MVFFRIINDTILHQNVKKLGIPKEQFISPYPSNFDGFIFLTRCCFSIGDWGIISGLPYALKQLYPNCKVFLPNTDWIHKIIYPAFAPGEASHWEKAWENSDLVFKNNPYIDGYVDNWYTEVYHDHFRVYDSNNPKITLTQQMCKFHHIPYDKCTDLIPKLYFDQDEEIKGNLYLSKFPGEFNFLHLSDRYTEKDNNILLSYIKEMGIEKTPFMIYYKGDINQTPFNQLNIINNINDIIDPRVQFYVKSKAKNVIGVQTGATDVISGLTQVHSLHHSTNLEDTWAVGNFIPTIKYINRKDYE